MEKLTVESKDVRCILCAKTTIDEVHLGPMYRLDDVVCHYFCVLFSSGLPQNGVTDEEGILGFLTSDIKKEVLRVSKCRLKCVFCGEKGASVGCSRKKCRQIWHFPCGAKNGINHQFFGNYDAFCANDYKLPSKIKKHSNQKFQGRGCPICFETFKGNDAPLFGSCCTKSVFHRDCVQKYALNSGSLFKCPTCSKQSFKLDAEWQGVFVPEQDASWELEPNAFRDLSRRRLRCDSDSCRCLQGRNFRDVDANGEWYIVRCNLCGGTSTHVQCGQVNDITSWACNVCKSLAPRYDDAEDSSESDDDDELFIAVRRKRHQNREEDSTDSSNDDDLFMPVPRKIRRTEVCTDSSDDDDLFEAVPIRNSVKKP